MASQVPEGFFWLPPMAFGRLAPEKPMRVLFTVHQYFPRHVGGTEMLVRGLVRRLMAEGHEAGVVTYVESPSGERGDFGPKRTEWEGVPLWEIHYNLSCDPFPARAEYDNGLIAEWVCHIAQEFRPDVIHAVSLMKLGASIVPRLKLEGFQVVVTPADYWPVCLRHTLLKPDNSLCVTGPDHAYRCLQCATATHGFADPGKTIDEEGLSVMARRAEESSEETPFRRDVLALSRRKEFILGALLAADRLILLSDFQRQEFTRHGFPPERLEVCQHGVEPEEVAPVRLVEPLVPVRSKRILFIGTLVPQKGLHILLEAMRRVPGAAIGMVVIGSPGNEPDYNREVLSLAGTDSRVSLCGQQSTEEVQNAYSRADVLVHPSLGYENGPFVVKAALASGVPVAVSDIGTLSGMVDESSGWVIPAGDVEAWADWLSGISSATQLPRPDPGTVPTAGNFFRQCFEIYESLARQGQRQDVHLIDLLDSATVTAPKSHVQVQTFVIGRVSRDTVFAHPPSRIVWPAIHVGHCARLETFIAAKPSVWDKITGPVLFRVSLKNSRGLITPLWEREWNPGEVSDRTWIPCSVDLSAWEGAEVELIFETLGAMEGVGYGWVGWGDPRYSFHATMTGTPGKPLFRRKPDVFLITCDALRRDHLGCYGAPMDRTPNLDSLASSGLKVLDARSQSDTTLGSFVSLLSGRMPHETGVISEWGQFPPGMESLPGHFAGEGYHTIFAPSENELGLIDVGIAPRFDETIPCLGNPAQSSEISLRRVIERLKNRKDEQPVFVWLHLFEPHPPAMPKDVHAGRFWLGDPSLPFFPEQVRGIHAVETCLDLAHGRESLNRSIFPSSLLNRLEESLRVIRGRAGSGPDFTAHLSALGESAMFGWPKERFFDWLEAQLLQCRAKGGQASGDLVGWVTEFGRLLSPSEADLLGWLDGVQDIRYPLALYAGAIAGVDAGVGKFVRFLKEQGTWDSSLVVFTSPHGESLNDSPMLFEHHHPVESVLQIPLLIKPPKEAGNLLAPDRMDLTELGGCMLDLAGVKSGSHWPGRCEESNLPASIALGMQAGMATIRRAPFKLVRFHFPDLSWPLSGRPEGKYLLFHDSDQPVESVDVSGQHPEVVKCLAQELEKTIPEAHAVHLALLGERPLPASGSSPTASVILVNFNGLRHLAPCLESLRLTTGVTFEIILVDNASTDGSVEAVARDFPEVRILPLNFNAGFGEANRRGVDIARGRFPVFLNNDTIVHPGWLSALVRAMEEPDVAAACSTLIFYDEPHLYNGRGISVWRFGFARERDVRIPVGTAPEVPRFWDSIAPTGAAMIVRREDFEKLGGFDSTMFMYYEDVDLGWRIWLSGKRVVAVSDSIILHHGSATTRKLRTNRWKFQMGHRHLIRTLIKCYEWKNLKRALRGHLEIWTREGDWFQVAAVIFWNLLHLPSALRARSEIQKHRTLRDSELFERGLIEAEDLPPPLAPILYSESPAMPPLPVGSHVLLPGQLSSETRLGSGWHPPEVVNGESIRWTSGSAECSLLVKPGQSGTLTVELALSQPSLRDRQVMVTCNGVSDSRILDSAPQRFDLAVRADSEGCLKVKIVSPSWKPSEVEANSKDSRRLGCRVSRLRFMPEDMSDIPIPKKARVIISNPTDRRILDRIFQSLGKSNSTDFDVLVCATDEEVFSRCAGHHRNNLHPVFLKLDFRDFNNLLLHAAPDCDSDILIFLDGEYVPSPGFVDAHMNEHCQLMEPGVVVGLTVRASSNKRSIALFPFRDLQIARDCTFSKLDEGNISFARQLLMANRVYETFRSPADILELCYRLSAKGIPLLFANQAGAVCPERRVHELQAEWRSLDSQADTLISRHPELRDLLEIGPMPSGWRLF